MFFCCFVFIHKNTLINMLKRSFKKIDFVQFHLIVLSICRSEGAGHRHVSTDGANYQKKDVQELWLM